MNSRTRPVRPSTACPAAVEPLEHRSLFAAVPVTAGTPLAVQAHQPQLLLPGSVRVTAAQAASPTLTATVAWGDGTRSTATVVAFAGDPTLEYPEATHAYARPGRYAVRVTVADGRRVVGRLATAATVTPNPTSAVALRARAGIAFDGTLAVYTADQPLVPATEQVSLDNSDINWGDGTTSGGTVAGRTTAAGQNVIAFEATHTYAKPGRYAVTVGGTVTAAGDGATPIPTVATDIPLTAGTAIVRR